MALETVLRALAQWFRLDLDASGSADRRFVVRLLSTDEKLSVTDLVTTVEVVPAPIDLSWRTKDVRFDDPDITDPDVVGGMPITDLLGGAVATVTTGPTSPPGVAGVVGTLTGSIPLPIPVTRPKTFDVMVDVRWRVRDERGAVVSDVDWSLSGMPALSGSGGDVAPPLGRAMDALSLVFGLFFAELTSTEPPTVGRRVGASIRLEAGGVSTEWIELPPVDLTLPAILVPTIAILCQDTEFKSNKLVIVPASSLFDRDTVAAAVTELRDTLAPLRATFGFLGLFLDSAAMVADLLQSGSVTFRKANEIKDLNDIDLESGFFNDTEAEDELSSMVMVGPPRRRLECFNAKSFGTSEGQMNLTVGMELITLVGSTHSASPSSDPPGRVGVPFTPAGTRWSGFDPWQDITSFGDEFSSIRFSWG